MSFLLFFNQEEKYLHTHKTFLNALGYCWLSLPLMDPWGDNLCQIPAFIGDFLRPVLNILTVLQWTQSTSHGMQIRFMQSCLQVQNSCYVGLSSRRSYEVGSYNFLPSSNVYISPLFYSFLLLCLRFLLHVLNICTYIQMYVCLPIELKTYLLLYLLYYAGKKIVYIKGQVSLLVYHIWQSTRCTCLHFC